MIVRHFDVKTPETQPPQNEGWEQTWAGYYAMTKCLAQQRKASLEEPDHNIRAEGCTSKILGDINERE